MSVTTHTTQSDNGKPAAQIVQSYAKVQDETTPPDQVILLLLDGVRRFIETARAHIDQEEFEEKNFALVKAQVIVKELMVALDPAIGDSAYRNLRGLYFFVYRRLVEANVHNDEKLLDEAARVAAQLREIWGETVEAYRKELSQAAATSKATVPGADSEGQPEPVVSLSVEG